MTLVFYTFGTCGLQINLFCYVPAHVDQHNKVFDLYAEGYYGYKGFFTIDDAAIVLLKMASVYRGIYQGI